MFIQFTVEDFLSAPSDAAREEYLIACFGEDQAAKDAAVAEAAVA